MTNDSYRPVPPKPLKEPKPFGLVDLFMFAALLPIGIACAVIFNNEEGPKI